MTPNFLDTSTNAVDPSFGNSSQPMLGNAKVQGTGVESEKTVRFGKVLADLEQESASFASNGTAKEPGTSPDSPTEMVQITLAMANETVNGQEAIETPNFELLGDLAGTLPSEAQELPTEEPRHGGSVEIVAAPIENVLTTFMEVQPFRSPGKSPASATHHLVSEDAAPSLSGILTPGLSQPISIAGKSISNLEGEFTFNNRSPSVSENPIDLRQTAGTAVNSNAMSVSTPSLASALLPPENEVSQAAPLLTNEALSSVSDSIDVRHEALGSPTTQPVATTSVASNVGPLSNTNTNPEILSPVATPLPPTGRNAVPVTNAAGIENPTIQTTDTSPASLTPVTSPTANTSSFIPAPVTNANVNVIPTVLRTIRNQNNNFADNSNVSGAAAMESENSQIDPMLESENSTLPRPSMTAGETSSWQNSDPSNTLTGQAADSPISEYLANEVGTADNNSFSQIEASLTRSDKSRISTNGIPEHLVDLEPATLTKPILESVRKQLSQFGVPQADAMDKGIKIDLDPRELGSVTVEVKTVDNVTKIQIVADQPVAHALLEKNIEALLQSLDEGDGNTFDVDVSQRDSDAQSQREQKQQQAQSASTPSSKDGPSNSNPNQPDPPSEGGVNMVV
ncbi:MAG: flagellar hook-length control protein FliK [Pirellulaceae bacterium]|nr:flagellar hook-length control protein FliK [Pirellulaceae bacterium]